MLFCKGVLGVSSSRIMRKSSPKWDFSPVEITIPTPFPFDTNVPGNKTQKVKYSKVFVRLGQQNLAISTLKAVSNL